MTTTSTIDETTTDDDLFEASVPEQTRTEIVPGRAAQTVPATPTPHVPGGVPAVPALVVGVNSAVGLASAATIVGGPVAIGIAATAGVGAAGAVAVRVVKVRRERRAQEPGKADRAGRKAARKAAAERSGARHGQVGRLSRMGLGGTPGAGRRAAAGSGAGRTGGARAGGAGRGGGLGGLLGGGKGKAGAGKGGGAGRSGAAKSGAGKAGAGRAGAGRAAALRAGAARAAGAAARTGRAAKKAASAAKTAAGGVRAARAAKKATGAGATRAEQRKQRVAERREAAAARRAAGTGGNKPKGPTGAVKARGVRGRLSGRAATWRSRAHERRDALADARVAAARNRLRFHKARQKVRLNALRYWAKCAGAALLVLPLAVVGVVTTRIGRALGASWLMYPGRRAWARLTARARAAREKRDAELAAWDEELAAWADGSDDDEEAVADTVVEAPAHRAAGPTHREEHDMSGDTGGFNLAEMCEEIQGAAGSYDPEGAMQVVALVDTMPEALASFASVFRTLAQKADEELPFHASVAEALNSVYELLMGAAEGAEELPTLVKSLHAADIARIEEPRPGEDKWDTPNNE